jgi:hypothetical protein
MVWEKHDSSDQHNVNNQERLGCALWKVARLCGFVGLSRSQFEVLISRGFALDQSELA